MLKEITQKIIELLKADAELGIPEANFFSGPPYTRNLTPFCYVAWAGGPIIVESFGNEVWRHNWNVVVVDVAKEDNVALQSVMAKIERIKAVLSADHTLSGLVRDCLAVSMEGEVMTVGADWGKIAQIIAAARLMLRCEVVVGEA